MAFCIKDITASLPWVIIICLTGISAQDCNNYNSLPNLHDRDPTIQYSPTNPAICDDSLPEGWYRASVYDMATSPVPQNRCGTVEGFYMDIAVPTDLAEHDARACLSDGVDHCFYYVNIKVKNCGDYRIYYLPSSGFCSSAYCFHLKDETLVPSYILPTPSVNFNHLEWKESGSDKIPQLVFRCDFQPSATESDLLYFVSWSVNKTDVGSDKIVTTSTLSNGHLYEEDITNAGFRHGIWLFCSVRTQYSISSPSTGRAMSSGFFAGFEIKRNTGTMFDTLYISEKDNAALRLSPTVPFGCENLNANCKLLIHIEDPDIGECEGSTFITESSRCQMEITGKTEADQGTYYTNGEYKTDYSMTLWHAQSEDSYDKKSHYTVALKTNTVKHLFWSNTSLRSIPVNIRYENSIWRGHQSERKFCAATGDPHFQTFDGIEYTFMGEGSYVLYENMNSSKTVHIKTSLCRPNHQATCTCGVAVRAGRDIFIMDTCSNSTIIDFPVCDDGVLDVRSDGDKKWKVTFPTGTIVRIDMYPWGRPWGGYLLNVFIYPSAADENNTRGLCGYMDGRKDLQFDYLKSDGTYSLDYEDFAQSWQLTEDYFFDHTNLDKFDKVGHWSNMTQLCVCPRATKNGKSPRGRFLEAEAEVHCSYKQFVGKCQTDRFKNFQCFVKTGGLKRRKRRAIHAHSYSNSVRNKRTVSYVVSEAEAQQQCEDTFNASSSYKGCSENGVSSVFMVSCINDYKILGEQSVFNVSLNAFLDTCVSIIGKDVELKSNNPSLVGELFYNSCQNNCTGHGYCDKGYCACDTGYAGSDCSFDIENPPTISSLKVFCDTLDGACDTISIYGRNFLNTNTFECKVSRIQILQDGSSVYVGSSIENGTQRSPFEAMCTLPMSDSSIPNVFVNAYNISVSNDGNSFSDISLVFVYDSLCQEVIESNGTTSFVFRNGYCFIDGSCIPDGQRNQKDICQQCLVTNDTYGWIQINDCTTSSATMSTITDKPSTSSASTSTSTTSANHIDPASSKPSTDIESSNTIVIVVAMCLVIGVIIALIVTIAVVKHYNLKQRESRPSNKLGSQIDIEFTTGRGPAKPVFQTDLNGLFCVEQDKHFDFSRPGSRASLHDSNDNTHVNFSTMINQ